MRRATVVVGPRASGKSTFCEEAIIVEPTIVLISLDKLLIEMFGRTHFDAYSGGGYAGLERMWQLVGEEVQSSPDSRIILDAWNGSSGDRSAMIRKLRNLGVSYIEAWYFLTPVEKVVEWFWMKPGIAKMSEMNRREDEGLVFYGEDAPRRDYQVFHRLAEKIDSDGFDRIIRINPLTTKPGHAPDLQTSLQL